MVDGTPNGILTAEIINWTGHVLSAPRTKLSELIKRDECGKTGIYFLVGDDLENSFKPKVYIGESEDISIRLRQHNKTEESGGKDFWGKVCLVTSKDLNLTKAHIKYLESRLIEIAIKNGNCELQNSTAHQYNRLPESATADMEYFLEQIRMILPVLGYNFLKENSQNHSSNTDINTIALETQKNTRFYLSTRDLKAFAEEIDGEFLVLKDSQVKKISSLSTHSYISKLRPMLIEQGVISTDTFTFAQNYAFTSPSAAAAVINGQETNGRKAWKEINTNVTYAEWQQNQVDCA
nr:GIY-YIG nuclease family protein [Acinetobacter portensis]